MMNMLADDGIRALAAGAERAAAAAIANTGRRLGATDDDIRAALTVLFAPIVSFNPISPSKVNEGLPLSPADKATIRQLITAGRDNATIAAKVGCSTQAAVGVRVGMRKQASS